MPTWAVDTLPNQRVPQKILKKRDSLYYIECQRPVPKPKSETDKSLLTAWDCFLLLFSSNWFSILFYYFRLFLLLRMGFQWYKSSTWKNKCHQNQKYPGTCQQKDKRKNIFLNFAKPLQEVTLENNQSEETMMATKLHAVLHGLKKSSQHFHRQFYVENPNFSC